MSKTVTGVPFLNHVVEPMTIRSMPQRKRPKNPTKAGTSARYLTTMVPQLGIVQRASLDQALRYALDIQY